MIPVNLGQRNLRVGLQGADLAQALAEQQPRGGPQMPGNGPSTNPRSMAVADVLSNPVSVESGTYGEAIAEALGAGLRGRAMRDVYGQEQARAQETQDYERGRQKAADGREIEQHQALMQRAQAEALAAQQGPEWQVGSGYSRAFRVMPDGSVQQGGEIPLRPRAAGGRAGVDPTPALPDGFVWE